MKTVKQISLSGQPVMFRLDEDAYTALERYLDRAQQRLKSDPDHAEVLRDLEQSIGEKLAARRASDEYVLNLVEVDAVLAQVGPVETGTGSGEPAAGSEISSGKRRLVRIQEGQSILGVCQGLSAYGNIGVDWVRTIFIGLALVTGGAFILVYFVAAFFMPVVPTRAAYFAEQRAAAGAARG